MTILPLSQSVTLFSLEEPQSAGTGNKIQKADSTTVPENAILNGLTSFTASQNGSDNSAYINVNVDTGQTDSSSWNSLNIYHSGDDNTSTITVGDTVQPRGLTMTHNVQGNNNQLTSSYNANGEINAYMSVNGESNTVNHVINVSDTSVISDASLNLNVSTNSSTYNLNQNGVDANLSLNLYGDASYVTTNVNQNGDNAYAYVYANSLPDNATITVNQSNDNAHLTASINNPGTTFSMNVSQ
ncbi:hypothetical protein L1D55_13100 [Vibrio sp. Isolate22]|uniref:hypothetical protein n=1 Tax=Vibrio sp. Isolate22 TaxID=2908532 RepID=UPI001EFDBFB4|nr:hypothetical protein [Vibrio sp. Isolate22]MCG9692665.1 hypothetical protein [Vibrio sp. Isolate22]